MCMDSVASKASNYVRRLTTLTGPRRRDMSATPLPHLKPFLRHKANSSPPSFSPLPLLSLNLP